MSRMITNGWALAGSEKENRWAAAELGITYDSNVEKETSTSAEETSDKTSGDKEEITTSEEASSDNDNESPEDK